MTALVFISEVVVGDVIIHRDDHLTVVAVPVICNPFLVVLMCDDGTTISRPTTERVTIVKEYP